MPGSEGRKAGSTYKHTDPQIACISMYLRVYMHIYKYVRPLIAWHNIYRRFGQVIKIYSWLNTTAASPAAAPHHRARCPIRERHTHTQRFPKMYQRSLLDACPNPSSTEHSSKQSRASENHAGRVANSELVSPPHSGGCCMHATARTSSVMASSK